MGDTGLDLDDVTACQNKELRRQKIQRGAKSVAFISQLGDFSPDLAEVIAAWESLSEPVRQKIVAMVREPV
jgi:hypothetical protein